MIVPVDTTACFTGHRPDVLGGYDKNAVMNLLVRSFLREAVEESLAVGYTDFVSGGALGVDQWAADIVLDYPEARLVIALPFADYGSNWPESSRDELKRQCSRAHLVHVVCEGGYETYKNHVRNVWMVDNSSRVIAVWNGSGDGGTASCVRYAFGKSKPFLRYNPVTDRREPVESVPKRSKK
jgi:uncharacterized phage-like protein YoqJ